MEQGIGKIGIGIDIGTSKIAIAVGQHKEGLTNIIGIGTTPNSGLRRGTICDPEEVISSLSAAVEDAQRVSGVSINHGVLGINGEGVRTSTSRGVVAVSRPDGEIDEQDIDKAVDSARSVALPPNNEIIHVFPQNFTIDGGEQTKEPLGIKGTRLEVEIMVVGIPSANITNLTKVTTQTDIQSDTIIFNPIAAARAILSKQQKEQGVMLIDIGAGTTSYAIYAEGEIVDAGVLPVGSNYITNDIAVGLRTTLEMAEKIKREMLEVDKKKIKDTDMLDLSKITGDQDEEKITKHKLFEIADARLKEIFSMARKELKRNKLDGLLPAGAILTGGGANLKGIVSNAKEGLQLPVQIGIPSFEVGGMVDKLDDPSYSTSIGLMLYGLELGVEEGNAGGKNFGIKNVNFGGIVGKAKNIFKQFLP